MSYICKPILPVSTVKKQQSSNDIGLGAVHGLFVILISTVWIALGAVLFLSARTLLFGSWGIETVVSFLVLIICGWAFFPNLDSAPPAELCVTRSEFPALYDMVAQVAYALDVPMPKLVLTEKYTAGFGRFGWRHEPVLVLGHGLLSIATRPETILLLAHELYHVNNSGWSHSRIVKITANGIHNLLQILSLRMFRPAGDIPRAFHLPLAPLMLLTYAFKWCIAYEMQQIEVEADEAALRLSPNYVMESLMKKASFGHVPPVQNAYHHAAPAQKYDAIRSEVDNIDPVRFARLWGAIMRKAPSVFDKHPSVAQRIATAEQYGHQRVRLLLSMRTYNLAHQELKQWPVWLETLEQRLNPSAA